MQVACGSSPMSRDSPLQTLRPPYKSRRGSERCQRFFCASAALGMFTWRMRTSSTPTARSARRLYCRFSKQRSRHRTQQSPPMNHGQSPPLSNALKQAYGEFSTRDSCWGEWTVDRHKTCPPLRLEGYTHCKHAHRLARGVCSLMGARDPLTVDDLFRISRVPTGFDWIGA